MHQRWIVAASCALVLAAAREAHAIWSVVDVTPTFSTLSERTFSVTAEPAEALLKVRVTVKPLGKKLLSPYLSGAVMMYDGKRYLGEISVEEYRDGEGSVFSMKLDPQVARNSRFEIHESTYIWKKGQTTRPSRDEPHAELLPLGGQAFRLDLGQFLTQRKSK